ncbi:hypothetical protein J3458_015200 [Metarhizium acridum]|uniref:uncharacterized protein n=1 Tax=Metarhizium acridum TaxID=92637 RepID=UPI001C6CDA1D|nr:hypothetical protein J3458_015200 [Metarhizium acridum]
MRGSGQAVRVHKLPRNAWPFSASIIGSEYLAVSNDLNTLHKQAYSALNQPSPLVPAPRLCRCRRTYTNGSGGRWALVVSGRAWKATNTKCKNRRRRAGDNN